MNYGSLNSYYNHPPPQELLDKILNLQQYKKYVLSINFKNHETFDFWHLIIRFDYKIMEPFLFLKDYNKDTNSKGSLHEKEKNLPSQASSGSGVENCFLLRSNSRNCLCLFVSPDQLASSALTGSQRRILWEVVSSIFVFSLILPHSAHLEISAYLKFL
jgi:hypothetical protein